MASANNATVWGARLVEIQVAFLFSRKFADKEFMSAFYSNRFSNIQLPNGLKAIGQNTFGNGFLEEIEIPETVRSVGDSAFADSRSLKSVRFKGSLPSFGGSDIFSSCLCLETIIVPRHEFVNYKGSPYLSAWNDKIVYE